MPKRRALELLASLATLALFAAWLVFLRPEVLGGSTSYVLVSGTSMEPRLSNGDVVVARRRDSYRRGAVVAYRVPKGEAGAGAIVIHRIVGGSEASGYVVQGDNRTAPDLWRPKSRDIIGALWLSMPRAGRALAFLGSPLALAAAAGAFGFALVFRRENR
jgi:signal peptidase I